MDIRRSRCMYLPLRSRKLVKGERYACVRFVYSGSERECAAGGSCEGLRMGERATACGLVAGTRKARSYAMHRQKVDLFLSHLPPLPAEEAAPDAQLWTAPVIRPVPDRSQWKLTPPPAERTLKVGASG